MVKQAASRLPSLGAALAVLGNPPEITVRRTASSRKPRTRKAGIPPAPSRAARAQTAFHIRRPASAAVAKDAHLPEALAAALLMASRPSLAATAAGQPLPNGVSLLIRIASGSGEALAEAVRLTGKDPALLYAAAVFYLEAVLWCDDADDHRVLGVNPGASVDERAEPARWLIRGLVPHLGKSEAASTRAQRVFFAWTALNSATNGESQGRARPLPMMDRRARLPARSAIVRGMAAATGIAILVLALACMSQRLLPANLSTRAATGPAIASDANTSSTTSEESDQHLKAHQ